MQHTTLFLPNIGWMEGLIILVIVLILFGGRKIPMLAKDLGTGIREFKKSLSGTAEEITQEPREESSPETGKSGKRKKA